MSDYVQRLRATWCSDLVLQLPSVSVALWAEGDRLLLTRYVEGGRWLLPGGSVEPGERPSDAPLRECWEETGLHLELTRLVGVLSGAGGGARATLRP